MEMEGMEGVHKIRLTGGNKVEIVEGKMVITPDNDHGFAIVVQSHKDIYMWVYHPLSGWYIQSGPGMFKASEVPDDPSS